MVVLAHPDPGGARPTGGRPVTEFVHRAGMITKPEVRSAVLGHLDLPARGVLWDLGAGSGSVAIEAALAAPGLRVVAVERDPAAAAAVVANAAALGAVVEVVEAAAPAALAGLPDPTGCSSAAGASDVLDAALAAAAPGARVVATYAAADRALAARERLGGLAQVSVDRATDLPDGGVRFEADNPGVRGLGRGARDGPGAAVRGRGGRLLDRATAAEVDAVVAEALDAADAARRRGHRRPPGRPPAIPAGAVAFPAGLLGEVDGPQPQRRRRGGGHAVGGRGRRPAGRRARGPAGGGQAQGPRPPPPPRWLSATGPDPSGGVRRGGRLGPGDARHRTPAAVVAVRGADAVIGYGPYVDAVRPLLRPDQLVVRSTMGAEAARAGEAVALAAAGWRVAVVSSGDPGVFAMASVTLELAAGRG